MGKPELKIEIDEELLQDSGLDDVSFDGLKEKFFTLKRFNLVCKEVYSHKLYESGIYTYISRFIEKKWKLLKKQKNIAYEYNTKTYSLIKNIGYLWLFSISRKNKIFLISIIKNLTSKDIDFNFKSNSNKIYVTTVILILSFIVDESFIKLIIKNIEFYKIIEYFIFLFFAFSFLESYLLWRVKINSKEGISDPDENYFIDLIFLIFHLKKIENQAIKNENKNYHILISLGYDYHYKNSEFQKNFAHTIFDYLKKNRNISVTINNNHISFLATLLGLYQKEIEELNDNSTLKDQFVFIQSFVENRSIDELDDVENNFYQSVRYMSFPNTGNFPFSYIPSSTFENEMQKRADELNKTKFDITKSLATELSHEIRNPIAVIQLIADNILSGKIENVEEQKLYLKDILKQTDRVAELLKYFSSIETNKKSGSKEIHINKIIKDAFHYFKEQLESNSIHVEYDLEEGIDPINGIPESLANVFVNLIRNSIYALKEQENKNIYVKSFQESDFVKVEFRDNGSGIPLSAQTKIFNPFFTTKETGSGIGLWLSYRAITEEFGGTISFYSEEGGGTVFFISLPINKEKL